MSKLLIVGDPRGVHSKIALLKYKPEDIGVWENDSSHIYTIKQICDRINVVNDLDSFDGMYFTDCISNPPYKSMSPVT